MASTPSPKEKLEKQLHLLQESFNSGIIDKEEYENSKAMVEKKIEELPKTQPEPETSEPKPPEPEQPESGEKTEKNLDSKYHWDKKDNFKEYFGADSNGKHETEKLNEDLAPKIEDKKEESTEDAPEPKEEKESEAPLTEPKQEEKETPKPEKEISQPEKQPETEKPKNEGLLTPKSSSSEEPKEEEKKDSEDPPKVEIIKEDAPPAEEDKKSRMWMWIGGTTIVVLILYFSSLGIMSDQEPAPIQPATELTLSYECMMDSDCAGEGKEYKCLNPGTEQAECLVQDAVPLTLTILTKNDCAQCDSRRILTILKKWFPGIQEKSVDVTSAEGQQLKEQHEITMLPAYFLEGNLPATMRFEEVGRAFTQSGNDYIMKNNAAGARLYLERDEVPNHLTVVLADDATSFRAAKNMKEFVDLFPQITVQFFFTKDTPVARQHACIAEKGTDAYLAFASCYQEQENHEACAQETGIPLGDITTCVDQEAPLLLENGIFMKQVLNLLSVPAFVINDQIRVMGVQSANDLKSEYCLLNPDEKCDVELTTKLI